MIIVSSRIQYSFTKMFQSVLHSTCIFSLVAKPSILPLLLSQIHGELRNGREELTFPFKPNSNTVGSSIFVSEVSIEEYSPEVTLQFCGL